MPERFPDPNGSQGMPDGSSGPGGHTQHPGPGQQAATDGEGYNYGRKVWSGGAGGRSSVSESTVSFSTSILDATIPVVYGERKVSGLCAALKEFAGAGGWLHCCYVFSYGEQVSISDLQLNDTPITDPELAGALFNINYRLGAASDTVPTHISDKLPDDARMRRYCYVTFTIRLSELSLPGALNVSAVLGGRKVEPVAGATGGTKVASTNPVLVANDILTEAVAWKGIDASNIDAASWLAAAQHCDEQVSGEDRYSYRAKVTDRNPERAAAEALMHGLAYIYTDVSGKLKLWQERRPPAAAGTWSTSGPSTTVTRDGGGDDFDDDFEGKRVFFDNEHRQIVEVVDAGQVTVDEAITLTAATLRYPSGIELSLNNYVNVPTADEIELGSVADTVIVKYTDPDEWGSIQYPETVFDSVVKRREVQLYGCTEAGMARRHSETRRDIDRLQPFYWSVAADGMAAPVEPGDVLFFTDDVLTNQAVRVVPPVEHLKSGAIKLKLRQFNMAAYSDSTQLRPSQLDSPYFPLDLPDLDYTRVSNDVPDKWGDGEKTELFNWESEVSSVSYPGRYEVVVQGYDAGSVYSDSSQPWIDLMTVEFTQGFAQLGVVGEAPSDIIGRQLLGSTEGISDYRLVIKEKGRADRRTMSETSSTSFNPAPPTRSAGMVQRYTGSAWEIATLDDDDVDLSGSHTGLLSGSSDVADAMAVLDDLGIELPTRQQVMNGSKTGVTDATATTVVTFTMPTGPSQFMAGLSFVGSCDNSTDVATVWLQGVLKCVRVSGGTVTAEWVETINETLASGSVTLGTCEVTENVSGADVQVRISLDSSLNQSWAVKWTALMSGGVTVTAS
jgi:hypothetical protein